MDDEHDPNLETVHATGGRVFGAFIGFITAGIGVTLFMYNWSQPALPSPFGGPPPMFRYMGLSIALVFIGMGVRAVLAGTLGTRATKARHSRGASPRHRAATTHQVASRGGYQCTQCAAPLAGDADVSPSGDVKCKFCGVWFNIHR